MPLEILAGFVAFAALVIVWAFAPAPRNEAKEAAAVASRREVAA
jgi:hypothetical protein